VAPTCTCQSSQRHSFERYSYPKQSVRARHRCSHCVCGPRVSTVAVPPPSSEVSALPRLHVLPDPIDTNMQSAPSAECLATDGAAQHQIAATMRQIKLAAATCSKPRWWRPPHCRGPAIAPTSRPMATSTGDPFKVSGYSLTLGSCSCTLAPALQGGCMKHGVTPSPPTSQH